MKICDQSVSNETFSNVTERLRGCGPAYLASDAAKYLGISFIGNVQFSFIARVLCHTQSEDIVKRSISRFYLIWYQIDYSSVKMIFIGSEEIALKKKKKYILRKRHLKM